MCFSNKTKVCCEKVVLLIGIIEIIFGIALAAFGFIKSDHGATIDFKGASIPSPQTALAIACLCVGLLTIIVGMFALCAAKYKMCCFTAPFMILSFIVCIFALVIAFMTLMAHSFKDKAITSICDNGDILKNIPQLQGKTLKDYNILVYDGLIDKTMCSEACPCDPNTKAETKKSFTDKMTPKSLTWNDAADSAAAIKNWKGCQDSATFKAVATQCAADNSNERCKALDELKRNAKFFVGMESTLKCSGLCKVPIFGMSRLVSSGPPEQECIGALIDKLAELKGVGVVALVNGIILLVSFFAALPLCTGFKQKEEGK